MEYDKLEGIVKRERLLSSFARLPWETLAIEILKKPIKFALDQQKSGDKLNIIVDRSGVEYIVINTDGKNNLCGSHPMVQLERMERLMEFDEKIHNYLLNPSAGLDISEPEWTDEIMPLRWASAGILPLVTLGKGSEQTQWIPMFFRDIWPAGWNIPLGASQRHFGEAGSHNDGLESELNDPLITSSREFLEETLILDGDPSRNNKLLYSRFNLVADAKGTLKSSQFSERIAELRKKYDDLHIFPSPRTIIPTRTVKTKYCLTVRDAEGKNNTVDNVLVAFSLSDLGIEVVQVVEFDIDGFDPYFLDGEILEKSIPEMTRMPVALISCDYLESVFSKDIDQYKRVRKCAESSIVVDQPLKPKHIKLFDWDHQQRLKIIECEKAGVGTEMKRYRQWADAFLDDEDNLKEGACRMFTPATAKILNLFFTQRVRGGVLNDKPCRPWPRL